MAVRLFAAEAEVENVDWELLFWAETKGTEREEATKAAMKNPRILFIIFS